MLRAEREALAELFVFLGKMFVGLLAMIGLGTIMYWIGLR